MYITHPNPDQNKLKIRRQKHTRYTDANEFSYFTTGLRGCVLGSCGVRVRRTAGESTTTLTHDSTLFQRPDLTQEYTGSPTLVDTEPHVTPMSSNPANVPGQELPAGYNKRAWAVRLKDISPYNLIILINIDYYWSFQGPKKTRNYHTGFKHFCLTLNMTFGCSLINTPMSIQQWKTHIL